MVRNLMVSRWPGKKPNWSEHNENVSKYQVSVDDELVRGLT